MPTAPNIDDPKYWEQRAKEARLLAERMPDETVRQTMLAVAEDYDRFAVMVAIHSVEETVGLVIDEVKRS